MGKTLCNYLYTISFLYDKLSFYFLRFEYIAEFSSDVTTKSLAFYEIPWLLETACVWVVNTSSPQSALLPIDLMVIVCVDMGMWSHYYAF
jgi:hypothetical protein